MRLLSRAAGVNRDTAGAGVGSRRSGRRWPTALSAVCRSGRASPRVTSLSNSRRRRRSEDLGVKVTRKKSYNVATLQGAGPPPPPIHYLLSRPRAGQSARAERIVGCAGPPMVAATALPHVAAGPAPGSAPAPASKRSAAGAELKQQKPAPTPPPAPGAIHKAWCPQQRESGTGGPGNFVQELRGLRVGFVPGPGGAGCRVTSPRVRPGSYCERKREAIPAPGSWARFGGSGEGSTLGREVSTRSGVMARPASR